MPSSALRTRRSVFAGLQMMLKTINILLLKVWWNLQTMASSLYHLDRFIRLAEVVDHALEFELKTQ